MTDGTLELTQYSGNHQYCRFYDGAAYTNLDAESLSLAGTPFTIIGDTNDYLYIGKDSKFVYVGFKKATAGSGGTYKLEYWDGAAWVDGTESIIYNNTAYFSLSGWIGWDITGFGAVPAWTWAKCDVTDPDDTVTNAYWIRLSCTVAPDTPATAYHLMRNVTLAAPIHDEGPEWTRERTYTDINGGIQNADFTYIGPDRYIVNVSAVALGSNMAIMNLLSSWEYYRVDVYIQAEVVTLGVVSVTADPYFRAMQGKLVRIPNQFRSPGKMTYQPGGYYPIEFKIDTVITQDSLAGLAL